MKNKKEDTIKSGRSVLVVDTGYESSSYYYGDYINAINSVTDMFLIDRHCSSEYLADCLELYAKQLREGC